MAAALRALSPLVVACLALGLWGCRKNTDPATAAYWIDKLETRSERNEALRNIGRIGDKTAVPAVLELLAQDGDWQTEAAYALGQLGDKSVVSKLEAHLSFSGATSTDARGRRAARLNVAVVRALAQLKATESTPKIKRLLDASDDRVREAALRSLGDLRDSASTQVLIDSALKETKPLVRLAAIQALGALGDAKAAPALIQLMFIEKDSLSFYEPARYALIQIGRAAVPDLLRTLRRENREVESIRMPDQAPIVEGAIEAKTAAVLGSLQVQEAVDPLAAALNAMYARTKKASPGSPAHAAVVEIAYALGNIGGPRAVSALIPLAKETDLDLRIAVCEALSTTGDVNALPALLASATTGTQRARYVAVVAASRLAGAAHLEAYDALGKTGDATVDAGAMQELVANERPRIVAASECGGDNACWRKKLGDKSEKVRERAAYELGWRAVKDAEDDLYKAAVDEDVEVRMAAVLSLSRFSGLDAKRLQELYDNWKDKGAYSGVNRELLRLIARAKSTSDKP